MFERPTAPPGASEALKRRGRPSISEALAGHRNSLGIIRLVLASLVIFDHAFPLGGFAPHDPVLDFTGGQASLGSFAVAGFFGISGYLIAKSGLSADVVQFLWRRVLRIFPAFWAVLLFSAVIVGPAIWLLQGESVRGYLTRDPYGPLGYLVGNATLRVNNYGIYDIFTNTTPYGLQTGTSVFNGSIWTLYYEFACYLIIAALLVLGILKHARFVVPVVTAFFAAVQLLMITDPSALAPLHASVPFLVDPLLVPLAFTFMAGATIAVYSKHIPYSLALGILCVIAIVITLWLGGFLMVGPIALAYLVLWAAVALPASWQWIGAKNDYSYGVYIYGFLAQQVLAYFGVHTWGYLPYCLIALAIAFGMAWLSWHLVEKRAMALKDWGPGKGIAHFKNYLRTRRVTT